jgi:microsomal dipeptidase-like Zn-dependent dipeptidase
VLVLVLSPARENKVEDKIKEVLNNYKAPFSFNGIDTIEDADEQEIIIDLGFYEDKDFADVVVLALNEFWNKNEQ